MTCLSSCVLGSTWLSPPKRFFGVFPKQFFPLVSQSPAVILGKLQKRFCAGFRRPFFTFVSHRDAASFKFFGRFRQLCFTFISKLRELLTCLTHGNPVRRDHPSCRCCWGILWAYFTKSGGRISKEKSETIIYNFSGETLGYMFKKPCGKLVSTNYISTQKTEYISLLKKR